MKLHPVDIASARDRAAWCTLPYIEEMEKIEEMLAPMRASLASSHFALLLTGNAAIVDRHLTQRRNQMIQDLEDISTAVRLDIFILREQGALTRALEHDLKSIATQLGTQKAIYAMF